MTTRKRPAISAESAKSASRKTVSHPAARVRKRDDNERLESRLRSAVQLIDVANLLTAPLTRSIENLLRLAGQSVGSDEASVLVRDGQQGGLKFLVAIGQVADKLKGMRIPPGKGISGFVFASGQPMVIADVAQEKTFYNKVDQETGYKTETLLTTPLRADDEVIGVLQFVNRTGEPPYEPHTPEEMDKAAYFADAMATLVEAHETAGLIETLFARAVQADDSSTPITPSTSSVKPKLQKKDDATLREWLKSVRAAPEHKDLMRLAVALREVAGRGEAERQLCRDVIESLAQFVEKRSSSQDFY